MIQPKDDRRHPDERVTLVTKPAGCTLHGNVLLRRHAPEAVVVSLGHGTGGDAHSGSRVRKWHALCVRLDRSSGKGSGRRWLWVLRNLIKKVPDPLLDRLRPHRNQRGDTVPVDGGGQRRCIVARFFRHPAEPGLGHQINQGLFWGGDQEPPIGIVSSRAYRALTSVVVKITSPSPAKTTGRCCSGRRRP